MGYFSNGTEGQMYEAEYCDKCIHNDEEGCPVMGIHFLYNGDKDEDIKTILDIFIPRKEIHNDKCTMFVEQKEN